MIRSTTLPLIASAALLLALAGCNFDMMDRADGLLPSANAALPEALGHEAHRMFEAEKRNASAGELPAQF